jgi:predicted nucleotidyltransferase
MQGHLIKAEKIEKIKEYLKEDPNVLFALLFGSIASAFDKGAFATDDLIKAEDIDIGIYFKAPPEGLELLEYINNISNLVNENIDLVVLNRASPFLRHQIMKNRIVLVIKDRIAYRNFREKTISDYQEYRYISGMDRYA